MEPLSLTVLAYVALKFVDQFIKEEGYGRVKTFLFPKRKYRDHLASIFYATITEYELKHPVISCNGRFPFYHSQVLLEELNQIILLSGHYSPTTIIERLRANENIIVPSKDVLNEFYELVTSKIRGDRELRSLFVDENYKEKIFAIADTLATIETSINLLKNDVEALKSNLIFQVDDEWFVNQCQQAILDLGNRYTPVLDVELDISEIFEGMGRSRDYQKKIAFQFDNMLIKGKKLIRYKKDDLQLTVPIESLFNELFQWFTKSDFTANTRIAEEGFNAIADNLKINAQALRNFYHEEEHKIQAEKNDYHHYHKYGYELRNIREFLNALNRFENLINGPVTNLANNPFLLIDGEAGIGKSHMFGDIVSKRMREGYESIFLLGQQFVTDEDPWTQIFKRLHVNISVAKFLELINERGASSGKKIIIFIDAINEGRGKYFWNDNVNSFVTEIRKCPWLGLALSIRTSYKDLILPQQTIKALNLVPETIYGFKNTEYEASKLFFNNYKIELPNVPLLHPEFQNPLFLKLFCEGINKSGLNKIPDGLQGITSVIDFFIKNVNRELAKPARLEYSDGLNLVSKSINAIIQFKIENKLRVLPYEKAIEVVEDAVGNYLSKKSVFLDELVSEGVLSKNLFLQSANNYEEGIYLAYERFEDHLISKYLLDKYKLFEKEFQEGGNLYEYVKDEQSIYLNKGLIDAFSIQVPEISGKELFDYIPQQKEFYPVIESFIESLLWRKITTIGDSAIAYVNDCVFLYKGTEDIFWETILAIASTPGHRFNADMLHNYLMSQTLADRDAGWTVLLKDKYNNGSSVKRLIDWAWADNDKTFISDESVKLAGIALAWFHTSTNRQLRDCSTKAMVSLFENRVPVLIEILGLFTDVNDPYIYERLFAVAYGCALRTKDKTGLRVLANYMLDNIFSVKGDIYPHILLRDYARGIVEYAHYLKLQLHSDIAIARPPYKSQWPTDIPSAAELKATYDNDDYYQLWVSVMGSGDFARYIIGTNHGQTEWSGFQFNEEPVDRQQLYDDFRSALTPEQQTGLDNLDPIISEKTGEEIVAGDHKIIIHVATGRKSEDELSAIRESFKGSLSPEELKFYDVEIEPFLDHNHKIINTAKYFDLRIAQQFIFSRVIALGWNPGQHLAFDKTLGFGRVREGDASERIGKKYQWIAYHEYLALLSDNFRRYNQWSSSDELKGNPFQGPWDPFVRDIDPTMLISATGEFDEENPVQYWWSDKIRNDWDISNQDWIVKIEDIPDFAGIIQVTDPQGEQWLMIEGHPGWQQPKKIGEEKWDYPHKRLWTQVRSYLIKDEEFDNVKEWARTANFMGRWMPQSTDRYEMYSREYYWSPAFDFFSNQYDGNAEWTDIRDKITHQVIAQAIVSTCSFNWSVETDHSKESSVRFFKPCFRIYNSMQLKQSSKEGEFLDEHEKPVCFATNIYDESKAFLLIKSKPFIKFLHDNHLQMLWTVLGEKEIAGGSWNGNVFPGRMEISGVFYLEDGNIMGSITPTHKD